jgi:hypothetical protein
MQLSEVVSGFTIKTAPFLLDFTLTCPCPAYLLPLGINFHSTYLTHCEFYEIIILLCLSLGHKLHESKDNCFIYYSTISTLVSAWLTLGTQ